MRLAVIGAGSWGTAVADLLCRNGHHVTLWSRRDDVATGIAKEKRNPVYLSEERLSDALVATVDLEKAVSGADVVVLAVPSHAMRSTVSCLADYIGLPSETAFVSLAKGIEAGTHKRMSEVISEVLGLTNGRVAVLSGPNHAEEVIRGIPTATVVSSSDQGLAGRLQTVFMAPTFRVYTNDDLVGVELGGASKNVVALAAGASDGLGFGDNTKAALMTRGLAEMARLGGSLGARARTFSGLSGLGDLIATCTSRHSRNRLVGQELGKGKALPDIISEMRMVAEGVKTTPAVVELARRQGVEMPIAVAVNQLLLGEKRPSECVSDLMTRGATGEFEDW